jgi:ubiquinone/menaquinone biosynthesis C-methylase UbiE
MRSRRGDALARRWDGGGRAMAHYRKAVAASLRPGMSVLHAGCGWDRSEVLKPHVASIRAYGLDIDPRVGPLYHSEFALGSLASLPFRQGVFDLVVSEYVLEHLTEPAACLGEIARVLRPGGMFLALTPNLYSYKAIAAMATPYAFHQHMGRLRFGAGHEEDMYPTVYRCNTAHTIKKAAARSGFQDVSISYITNGPTWFERMPCLFVAFDLYHRLIDRWEALRHLRCSLLTSMLRVGDEARPQDA